MFYQSKANGTEDVIRLLDEITPREASNLSRNVVHGVAGEARDQARQDAPRDNGRLRRSIRAVRRRLKFGFARSDVIITRAGFYWRFIERGTRNQRENPFMLRTVMRIDRELPIILHRQFRAKLAARIRRLKRQRSR